MTTPLEQAAQAIEAGWSDAAAETGLSSSDCKEIASAAIEALRPGSIERVAHVLHVASVMQNPVDPERVVNAVLGTQSETEK